MKARVFKFLRGLDADIVRQVLEEISTTSTIKEAIAQCNDIKQLQKIQLSFYENHKL